MKVVQLQAAEPDAGANSPRGKIAPRETRTLAPDATGACSDGQAEGGEESDLDAERISAVAAGDRDAMARIFDRFKNVVFGLALASLRDRDAALDVVSEVMAAVWQGAGRFEGRGSVRSWILRIAIFKIRDEQRRRARWPQNTDAPEKLDRRVDNPTEPSLGFERRALHECRRKLSDRHREALHLTFVEGLSSVEIGELLGVSPGTIRTRVYYAVKALRRCLAQKGVH